MQWDSTEVTDSLDSASKHMLKSLKKANEATITMMGAPLGPKENGNETTGSTETAYEEEDWEFDVSCETREELGIGEYVEFSKILDDDDVHGFAQASGDTNRLHLDDEFAQETRFKGRIVHGTLVSGLISAALARLPGLTIYLSQDVKFLNPVRIGEKVKARCEIVEDLGNNKYRLTTKVKREDDETVIDGEAIVLIDSLPEGENEGTKSGGSEEK